MDLSAYLEIIFSFHSNHILKTCNFFSTISCRSSISLKATLMWLHPVKVSWPELGECKIPRAVFVDSVNLITIKHGRERENLHCVEKNEKLHFSTTVLTEFMVRECHVHAWSKWRCFYELFGGKVIHVRYWPCKLGVSVETDINLRLSPPVCRRLSLLRW